MFVFGRRVNRPVGAREKLSMGGLLVVLVLVGGWVHQRGRTVDETLFRLDDASLASKGKGQVIYARPLLELTAEPEGGGITAILAADLFGEGWRVEGPVEEFDWRTLYEKIDGREGLYKSFGFKRLWWVSYVSEPGVSGDGGDGAGSARIEVEVFRQGSAMEAYGVFSAEREGMNGSEVAADRVVTPNGLYLVSGEYYIRMIGSEASGPVKAAVERGAASLGGIGLEGSGSGGDRGSGGGEESRQEAAVPGQGDIGGGSGGSGGGGGGGALSEDLLSNVASWTPARNPLVALGADPTSFAFIKEDGLGMDFFDGLYTAQFSVGSSVVKAFLFPAPGAVEASRLNREYGSYLSAQGEALPLPEWGQGLEGLVAVKVDLLDTFEWTLPVGRFVMGVTEAEDAGAAAAVARRLLEGLRGGPGSPSALPER